MEIIRATEKYLERIVVLCIEMHSETLYKKIQLNIKKLKEFIYRHLECPESLFIIVVDESKVVGMFVASLEYYFFSDELLAQDLIYYLKPAIRNKGYASVITSKYIDWCKEKKVLEACLSTSTGISPQKTCAIYEKMGFQKVGYITKMDKF